MSASVPLNLSAPYETNCLRAPNAHCLSEMAVSPCTLFGGPLCLRLTSHSCMATFHITPYLLELHWTWHAYTESESTPSAESTLSLSCTVAASAVMVYDWLLTLDREVSVAPNLCSSSPPHLSSDQLILGLLGDSHQLHVVLTSSQGKPISWTAVLFFAVCRHAGSPGIGLTCFRIDT